MSILIRDGIVVTMNDRLDIVDGELLVDDFRPVRVDPAAIAAEAREAARQLASRAGVRSQMLVGFVRAIFIRYTGLAVSPHDC